MKVVTPRAVEVLGPQQFALAQAGCESLATATVWAAETLGDEFSWSKLDFQNAYQLQY